MWKTPFGFMSGVADARLAFFIGSGLTNLSRACYAEAEA
jgi:hypothetical protein